MIEILRSGILQKQQSQWARIYLLSYDHQYFHVGQQFGHDQQSAFHCCFPPWPLQDPQKAISLGFGLDRQGIKINEADVTRGPE